MEVSAISRFVRMSSSKARDFAAKLKGLDIDEALAATFLSKRKAAIQIGKVLKSAIANAEHNEKMALDTLFVKEVIIDEAARMKRYWPTARGSAHPITKRLCHVKVVLSDERGKSAVRKES